jgi:hypothetical protein
LSDWPNFNLKIENNSQNFHGNCDELYIKNLIYIGKYIERVSNWSNENVKIDQCCSIYIFQKKFKSANKFTNTSFLQPTKCIEHGCLTMAQIS